MKKLILFLLIFLSYSAIAQVGINATGTAPSSSAMLDVSSTNKGVLVPRMNAVQKGNIPNKVEGLMVYDTDVHQFSYWTGSVWVNFGTTASIAVWAINGNAGNEIKNTNSGGFWSANPTGLDDNATNITNPPTAPVSGAGTRLMWIPSRSAFRVGTTTGTFTTWDAATIGLFSTATGLNTQANGTISTAIGQYTEASGNVSTAMGRLTTAIGFCSTAMGSYTTASGNYSTAMGFFNVNNPNGLLMVGNGNNTPQTVFIITKDNSRVGIGTETPVAPLHVAGYGAITGGQARYFYNPVLNATGFFTFPATSTAITIYAEDGIVSGTYIGAAQSVISSDSRIKNIIGLSNNAKDLAKLKQIEITDYTMKDVATWGNQYFKKVIAQQVESVYPEIISKQTKVIPDIYALAEK